MENAIWPVEWLAPPLASRRQNGLQSTRDPGSRHRDRSKNSRCLSGLVIIGRHHRLEVQEKDSAVGVIELAGDSFRLKDRIVTTQVFLTAY